MSSYTLIDRSIDPRHFRKASTEARKSLMPIIESYDLDPHYLVDTFIEAKRNTIAQCNTLTIRSRQQQGDTTIFLITSGETVITQLPIKHLLLQDADNLKLVLQRLKLSLITQSHPKQWTIGELQQGMQHVTIVGTVLDITPKSVVNTRWGTQSTVANATLSDGTGTIVFSLRNAQIDRTHVGDRVEIRSGYIVTYRDTLQIRLGQKGSCGIFHSSSSER